MPNKIGEDCGKCGSDNWYVRPEGRQCAPCKIATTAAWYAANPGKSNEYTRRSRAKHPERERDAHLRRTFGITPERYDEMLAAQGGVCAICGMGPGKRRLAVDHARACCPGKRSCGKCVRALLCANCNLALGMTRENPATLEAMKLYLTQYGPEFLTGRIAA